MDNRYFCMEGAEAEIIRKKSRFIARVTPTADKEEVALFLDKIRKEFWDARHHCHAFIVGRGAFCQSGCSDDGEPAKTAGRPILEIMIKRELTDACLVVTRYFGGTLLGTGGLVRAYQDAAVACLERARIFLLEEGHRLEYLVEYDDFARLRRIMEEAGAYFAQTEYGQYVRLVLACAKQETENLIKRVLSETAGRVSPLSKEETGFIRREKGIVWKN